jgi:amino acid adenylation domain-containing protein
MSKSITAFDYVSQDVPKGHRVAPTNSFIEFRREEVEQSISDRFEEVVRRYPERIAIKTRDEMFTYEELNHAANRIAGTILANCRESDAPIVLFLEKGAALIASILGVLKAGKIYVPLTVSYPSKRIVSILGDCQPRLILTNRKNFTVMKEVAQNRATLVDVDDIESHLSVNNPRLPVAPDALAYILYTSGSTGEPKGLLQNQRNVLHNTMCYTNRLHLCADDRLTLLHSCSYGASINNLFGALLNGGALFPFDVEEEGIVQLPEFVRHERITIYHSVPMVFRNFVSNITGEENFPDLRIIHLSGAPASRKDVELYRKNFSSHCVFVHRLGSTESNSVFFHFVDKNDEIASHIVPVGYPVEDKKVLLLDENGAEVEINGVGEIVVKSRFLSPGYWRDPSRTQSLFSPDPDGGDERLYRTGDLGRMCPDGCFEHLGRVNNRVKVRGHRIELTEVELALMAVEYINEAAVVLRDDKENENRLVAYIVPEGKTSLTVTTIRDALRQSLPEYMIPSDFVFLDALPLTPNGKLDREALPDPSQSRPALDTSFVVPKTTVEKQLTQIWAEILAKDCVGIDDNFFDLGGHSLLASQILSRIQHLSDVELTLNAFFEKPTIAGLAHAITEAQAKKE